MPSIVIAVRTPALARVIAHLCDNTSLRVVATVHEAAALAPQAALLQPEVIVADARLMGRGLAAAIAEVRRSSPGSKVVLISPLETLARAAARGAADAYVEEELLVHRLQPTVLELTQRAALA